MNRIANPDTDWGVESKQGGPGYYAHPHPERAPRFGRMQEASNKDVPNKVEGFAKHSHDGERQLCRLEHEWGRWQVNHVARRPRSLVLMLVGKCMKMRFFLPHTKQKRHYGNGQSLLVYSCGSSSLRGEFVCATRRHWCYTPPAALLKENNLPEKSLDSSRSRSPLRAPPSLHVESQVCSTWKWISAHS